MAKHKESDNEDALVPSKIFWSFSEGEGAVWLQVIHGLSTLILRGLNLHLYLDANFYGNDFRMPYFPHHRVHTMYMPTMGQSLLHWKHDCTCAYIITIPKCDIN